MIAEGARRMDEGQAKKLLSVDHWVRDASWTEALERLVSRPTVNIEGLVGGYTGPGGKTILPHRAVAKIDMRLVPDMKELDAIAALKAHLAKHGFDDLEVGMPLEVLFQETSEDVTIPVFRPRDPERADRGAA